MAEAIIIDGKAFAANLRAEIALKVSALKKGGGPTPGLAVLLVGENPASQIYTRNKAKQTVEVGMQSFKHDLAAETSQEELLALIDRLNHDPAVHGILVQLPLPPQIDPNAVIDAIDPAKDVDGFNVINVGRLFTGNKGMIPCTPLGCLMLLKHTLDDLKGKRALVLGRSNIVGKPMALLLLREHCTVTLAHSKTQDLAEECRHADILIAATGHPEMVRGDWIKTGATIIDVGINRIEGTNGKSKLVGDVAFNEAILVAGAITPVPGGVGPMTIACLLKNTFRATCQQTGADPESF